jgi:hypothetical protein
MQGLPIGEQSFIKIRELNMLYVDKTAHIYDLLKGSVYNFLSRPRRFGKSLTLSTIQAIFQGKKELFKGLWIENHWDWSVQNPVIYLPFNRIGYGEIGLVAALVKALKAIAAEYEVATEENTPGLLLRELILKLASKYNKVVLLIDEYDKPLIDYLGKEELVRAKAHRSILKNFHSSLKDNETQTAMRFFLITGVSKFSQVSLFSGLNYLSDITLSNKYNTLLGYTQQELVDNFADYLPLLQEKMQEKDLDSLLQRIKTWYNGYSWDGNERVYNPFSILLLFKNLSFHDFWFKTGTPTFLVELLKEQEIYLVDEMRVSSSLFDSYDLENIDARSLMFQTGYLTVKHFDPQRSRYTLAVPNREVEEALNNYLIANLLNRRPADSILPVEMLEEVFLQNDLAKVILVINALLRDLPSHLLDDKTEHFYHALVHLHFRYLGLYLESEVHTADGRMDAVVQTPSHVFIIEFKMNTKAQAALDQIVEIQYADKYRLLPKSIVGLGISFDTKKKKVKDWKSVELSN